MHITQLEYFLRAADTGSISRTAENLFVSQSAVSKQILLLEKELGFPLFDRGCRQIQLTEAGHMFRECLLRCENDFTNTMQAVSQQIHGNGSLLRVGYVEYWDSDIVEAVLRQAVSEIRRDMALSLEPYRVMDLADALNRGNIDLAISFDSAFHELDNLSVDGIGGLLCGMLYSKSHFGKDTSRLRSALRGIPVLETDDSSHPYRQELRMIMEKYGFNNPLHSTPRFTAMLAKLNSGQGIFLASPWCYITRLPGLGFLPLGRDLPISAAYAAKNLSQEKQALISALVPALRQN